MMKWETGHCLKIKNFREKQKMVFLLRHLSITVVTTTCYTTMFGRLLVFLWYLRNTYFIVIISSRQFQLFLSPFPCFCKHAKPHVCFAAVCLYILSDCGFGTFHHYYIIPLSFYYNRSFHCITLYITYTFNTWKFIYFKSM